MCLDIVVAFEAFRTLYWLLALMVPSVLEELGSFDIAGWYSENFGTGVDKRALTLRAGIDVDFSKPADRH